MPATLAQFATRCHDIIAADPGPAGRTKVLGVIEEMLKTPSIVADYLPDDGPERKIIYEDPEFGFCILAHVYHGAKGSPPHDHGTTWAIYGQAAGTTFMTDWEKVEQATEGKPGKARAARTYELTPGMAYLYNPGDLHSPRRDGATKLIRVEGVNVTKIGRLPYEAVEDKAA